MNKVFIIGLPRTGTTSVSVALLDHGFKVAHTAYSKETFAQADVFSDTPCYCDYPHLDALFPGSKFVYLERDIEAWLPSMQMLLKKMHVNLKPEGHFNPIIKRCFESTFASSTAPNPLCPTHLSACYANHKKQVMNYFSKRNDMLQISVKQSDGLSQFLSFIGKPSNKKLPFPHINTGNSVTAWRNIKHPNKANSSASGPERRKFFDYA